MIMKVALLIRW